MIIGLDKAMKSFGFYMHGITIIDGMETELKEFFFNGEKYSHFREGQYEGYYFAGSPISQEDFNNAFHLAQDQYYVAK